MRALAMYCPTVTLPGKFMRGRHGVAILKMIGLEELITDSADNYISVASQLGLDDELRENIVGKIAANKHQLFNDAECVKYLDHFLKTKVAEAHLAVASLT